MKTNPRPSAVRNQHSRIQNRKPKATSTRRRPLFETLERRELLAGDISISDGSAVEGSNAAHYRGSFVDIAAGKNFLDLTFGPDGLLYTSPGKSGTRGPIDRYDATTGAFVDNFVPDGGPIDGVRDIVFRDGSMYVASEYTDEVLRFDASSGAFLGAFVTAGSGGIDGPHGVSFGPDANGDSVPELYVSGRNSSNVVRYDGATGQPLGSFVATGSGGLNTPEGLTFDASNSYLYVASSLSNQVLKYSAATGAFAGVSASTGTTSSNAVRFGADGLLYVASSGSHRIMRFTATGMYVDDFVPAGSGGMARPYRMEFGPDGDLYVSALGSNQILRFGTESEVVITVSLASASSDSVSVSFATADATALAGSDYASTTGTITFAPGVTAKTILVPTLDDAAYEGNESFTVNLSNPVNGVIADGQGIATIIDNELPPTRFYVVNDGSPDRTYEYGANGVAVENYAVNSGNTAPRGAASNVVGDKVWVVDANKNVYVYNTSGGLLGSWTAGSLAGNADVQGIATNGTDVWIVDAKQDRVVRYAGAASRTSGSQNAASSFNLNSGNSSPTDIVTDGSSLWGTNDTLFTDKVFKYSVSGSLQGSWTISGGGGSPTGITLDPSSPSHLWIVDNNSDRVYQFDAAASRTSGSQSPSTSFALAAGNTNPQGIADPPVDRVQGSGFGVQVREIGSQSAANANAASDSALLAVVGELDGWLSGGKKRR